MEHLPPGDRSNFDELLGERQWLLVDGAMGTELFARGLAVGDPPELWNVEHPGRVAEVHRSYIEAGCDIILTNSFGGTELRLGRNGLQHRVEELNEAAARIGRAAADEVDRTVLVAGSMGPCGVLTDPSGPPARAACAAAFARQASALTAGGVDVLWIETMSELSEITAAVEGARSVSDLPITVTLSFEAGGHTLSGVTGTQAIAHLSEYGVAAVGANCGHDLTNTETVLAEMRAANPGIPLISKANAGLPERRGLDLLYGIGPETMAAHAIRQREAGVQMIGACCGSSPAHLAMMRRVLDGVIDPPG